MLAPWKESYDKSRQCIRKQKHHFADKHSYSQSYISSSSHIQMWELDHKEGWTLKNWCFQIVVLEKTLESPLDSKKINQSILKKVNVEYSLEGLMLELEGQYIDCLMWRAYLIEKTLMLGRIESRRRRGQQRMRWLADITNSVDMSIANSGRSWRTGKPGGPQSYSPWGHKRVGHDLATNNNVKWYLVVLRHPVLSLHGK